MPNFAERAREVPLRRNECDTCNFLAGLEPKYRAEVVEAMSDPKITTAVILKLLEGDGYLSPAGHGAFNRHRRGQCIDSVRLRLLGADDGVIR